jgi:predicted MFS family arabinose efflux permease
MGIAYFAGSLLTARCAHKLGRPLLLILGCVIQMSGLIGIAFTLDRVWPHPDILNLAPATMIIGFGQAFIVGSFFRIGLNDVPSDQAGAGSAMLSTVQQASFGLGSALLGAVFAQTLRHSGHYLDAVLAGLTGEFGLMSILLTGAILYNNSHRRLAVRGSAQPG